MDGFLSRNKPNPETNPDWVSYIVCAVTDYGYALVEISSKMNPTILFTQADTALVNWDLVDLKRFVAEDATADVAKK